MTPDAKKGESVEKIWLRSYPKGVPAEIDVNEYASVREVFEESCGKFATRPAFTCMGKTLTFAELDTLSAAFGAYLRAAGCKKGTRIALKVHLADLKKGGLLVVNDASFTPGDLTRAGWKSNPLTDGTVEGYRANLMRKLGLRNQTDLVRYALQGGLLPIETWIRQRRGN